jgi:hypothetical protein
MATSLNRNRSRRCHRPRFRMVWSKHLTIQTDSSSNRLGSVMDSDRPSGLAFGVASMLRTRVQLDFCLENKDLSRRDYRTQPGVLTPGTDIKDVRPESGGREVFALDAERDPQQIFCRPFRAGPYCQCVLGLKPQAQSYSPLGTKNSTQPKHLSTFSKPHQFSSTSTSTKRQP